jgi:hypothetical protein
LNHQHGLGDGHQEEDEGRKDEEMPTGRCLKSLAPLALLLMGVPAIALASDSLQGTWQHVKDSPSGWHVLTGGSATLTLSANGQATLSATGPNQNPLNQTGTWSQQGGRVTINISGEVEVNNKSFQLQGDTLTLPTQLSSDDPGTSTWMRVKSEGIGLIFAAFNKAVEDGEGGSGAAEEAAKEARKQEGVEKVDVEQGGEGLALTVKPPEPVSVQPKVYIWFSSKAAPRTPPVQRQAPISPLAADPRTHIEAQNPPGDPDAPKSKTALVVAPFHNKAYLAFRPELWKEGNTKPRPLSTVAQEVTFKSLGDDPEGVAKQLEKAGYNVTVLIDDQATPGPVFRALQARPTVIYFATHGGVDDDHHNNGIAVAGFIGATAEKGVTVGRLTPPVAVKRLHDLLVSEGLPGRAAAAVSIGCMEAVNGVQFCFPYLWPDFFKTALGSQGAPDSFVFLDACHTASYPALAQAFKPKVFLGYDPTVEGWATARFAKYLFENMVHRGHSVQEAWDRLKHMTEGAYVVYLEDSILSPVAQGDVDLKEEGKKLQAWGIDQKPYERINDQVFWLMRNARWASQDVNNGASALGRCYDLFWKPPGKRPGIGEPFCSQGTLGAHTPTADEVEDARFLVSGKPSKPVGRFVLR